MPRGPLSSKHMDQSLTDKWQWLLCPEPATRPMDSNSATSVRHTTPRAIRANVQLPRVDHVRILIFCPEKHMIAHLASPGISYPDHIVGRSGPLLYGTYKGNFNDDLGKDSRVINRFQCKMFLMRHALVLSNDLTRPPYY